MAYISSNPIGAKIVWDFFEENFAEIWKKFSNAQFDANRLIRAAVANFNSDFGLKKMENFFEIHKTELGPTEPVFRQEMENVRNNFEWMQKNSENFLKSIENLKI